MEISISNEVVNVENSRKYNGKYLDELTLQLHTTNPSEFLLARNSLMKRIYTWSVEYTTFYGAQGPVPDENFSHFFCMLPLIQPSENSAVEYSNDDRFYFDIKENDVDRVVSSDSLQGLKVARRYVYCPIQQGVRFCGYVRVRRGCGIDHAKFSPIGPIQVLKDPTVDSKHKYYEIRFKVLGNMTAKDIVRMMKSGMFVEYQEYVANPTRFDERCIYGSKLDSYLVDEKIDEN